MREGLPATIETEQVEKKWRNGITVARPLTEKTIERLVTSGMSPVEMFKVEKESKAEEFFFPKPTSIEVGKDIFDTVVTFVIRESKDGKDISAKRKIGDYLKYLGFNEKEARAITYQGQTRFGGDISPDFFTEKFSELLTSRWNIFWDKKLSTDEDPNVRAQRTAIIDQKEKIMAKGFIKESGGQIIGYKDADPINDFLDATDVIFRVNTEEETGKATTRLLAGQLTFVEDQDKWFYRGNPPIRTTIEDTDLITFPEHLEYGEMPLVVLRGGGEASRLIEAGLDNAGIFNSVAGQKLLSRESERWQEEVSDQIEHKIERVDPESITARKLTAYRGLFKKAALN